MDKGEEMKAAQNQADDVEKTSAEEECTAETSGAPSGDDALAKKDTEIGQLKEALLRTRADFDNFRKRCAKNDEMNKKLAVKSLALDIITINDNLIRASESALHIQEGDTLEHAHKSFVDGVMMISKSLEQSLLSHGVEEVDALNCPFNPVFHEAIEFAESDDVSDETVTKVYQKGFRIDAMVIRTAKVKVSKPVKANAASAGDSAEQADNAAAQ